MFSDNCIIEAFCYCCFTQERNNALCLYNTLQSMTVLHVILFDLYIITLGRHDRHLDAQTSAKEACLKACTRLQVTKQVAGLLLKTTTSDLKFYSGHLPT